MTEQRQNYYSNPAFCQKSEFYNQQCANQRNSTINPDRTRTMSPERIRTMSPDRTQRMVPERNRTMAPERAQSMRRPTQERIIPELRTNRQRNNSERTLSPDRTRAMSPERRQIQVRCSSERTLSPEISRMATERRHPPVGAQKPTQIENYHQPRPLPRNVQKFDKEILADEEDIIYSYDDQYDENEQYVDEPIQKNRYEYIPMQEQSKTQRVVTREAEIVEKSGGIHRYAVIPTEDNSPQKPRYQTHRYAEIPPQEDIQPTSSQPRYVEDEVQQKSRYAPPPGDSGRYLEETQPKSRYTSPPKDNIVRGQPRYAEIPQDEELKKTRYTNRYAPPPGDGRYPEQRPTRIQPQVTRTQPQYSERSQNKNRYEYIPEDGFQYDNTPQNQTPRKGNPVATQKLHELLITPEKFQLTPQKLIPPLKPSPFQTPKKTPPRNPAPKAQQKLNYALSTRYVDKRQNTAIIAPICSSPVQSVYSETTFTNKSESWMNLSSQRPTTQVSLAVAAFMMILCGGVSSGLCFYMVSIVGRMYYLDFGIISGFACLLLGCLGFRSRNCHWLPNRNYISGYIVLSAFSLLTCAGLLVLLFLQPKPGSPLADVTSGAVCGISGLSLILASTGVIASYCCKYPPPDNRVQHCARGFTV